MGGFTVKLLEPVTPPELAVIVTFPAVRLDSEPEALIVATLVLDELQLTEGVRFSVVPSLKLPVAVNC